MTFYQELQLNQKGSKELIKNCENSKEKLYHIAIYLFKILITVLFCFVFVSGFSMLFGKNNSIVGVVVLLYLLVYRNANFGVNMKNSIVLFALFFLINMIFPHLVNMTNPFIALMLNVIAIAMFVFLGCDNPLMFNQSTIVLSYLLLYGYDVSGNDLKMRVIALFIGFILIATVYYFKNKNREVKNSVLDNLKTFNLKSSKTIWQLSLVLAVSIMLFIFDILGMERGMWAAIATMSCVLPFTKDIKKRLGLRIKGNILGVISFTILFFLLPADIYAFIGIIGGIGVGLSVKYDFQSIFNTYGALAIASEAFGLKNALYLRLFTNCFGVIFALLFCLITYKLFIKEELV